MYINSSKDYWRSLRRMRVSPPPATATNDARRGTFCAALEQAEQLYEAASSVGMESKPILLYYGAYQAGRAIAAANADTSMPWQLEGHGLKAPRLSDRDRTALKSRPKLVSMIVRGTGKPQEAFPAIARMLNSPDLSGEIAFGDLLALLDESRLRSRSGRSLMFPSVGERPGPISVSIEILAARNGTDIVGIRGLPCSLLSGDDWKSKVNQFITDFYPQFDDRWKVETIASKGAGAISREGSVVLSREGEITRAPDDYFSPDDDDRRTLANELAVRAPYYSLDDVTDPTLPNLQGRMHRLCVWWATLFHLSMTARYSPNAWTDDLDVDKSEFSVGLEHLFEHALEEVPRIAGEVLNDLYD